MKEEISFLKKIALLLGVLFLLVSLYILRVPIVLLIGSVLLAFFAAPILLWTEKRRYPDWFGLILFYGAFGIFVLLLLFTLIPLLVEQFLRLSQSLPSRMDVSFAWLPESLQASLRAYVSENIPSISSFLIQTSKVVASKTALFLSQSIEQVIQFFLMSIGSILFILERREIEIFLRSILPEKYMNQIKKISTLSIGSIASWYIGQGVLAISLFLITLISLLILSIFFPLTHIFSLAVIAGIMEFIPFIGPFLALIPALLIGADISSSACVSILVVYLIIQQIENNLLVPYVQGKYLKISPSLVFFGMLFGAAAGGIVGMILSLPIVATIKSYWK